VKKAAADEKSWRAGSPHEARRAVFKLGAVPRKCRLFSVACCRLAIKDIRNPDCHALIDLVERRADDDSLAADVAKLRRKVHRWAGSARISLAQARGWYALYAAWNAADPQSRAPVHGFLHSHRFRDLLAEVYGPRNGGATFDAAWRTSTAVSLASQMYESRDFGAMPILADALQDAGCTSDAILNHCRDPLATHVRGCWVVDLVLGKV